MAAVKHRGGVAICLISPSYLSVSKSGIGRGKAGKGFCFLVFVLFFFPQTLKSTWEEKFRNDRSQGLPVLVPHSCSGPSLRLSFLGGRMQAVHSEFEEVQGEVT